jgi:hypothetical protein
VPVPPSRAATPVARWVRSGRPRRLLPFEAPEVRAGFASLAASGLDIGGYDVAWLSSAYVGAAAPDGLGRRVVLDLDDDQRELLRAARRARPAVGTEAGVRDRATVWARWGTAQVANAVDARRWDGVYDAKVVEAMANRLPVVSTAIGCEGIDVSDGVHLLVAEDVPLRSPEAASGR